MFLPWKLPRGYSLFRPSFVTVRAASLSKASAARLFALAVLTLSVGISGHKLKLQAGLDSALSPAFEARVSQAAQSAGHSAPVQALVAAVVPVETVIRETDIDDGQTFSDMLEDADVAESDAKAAMNALAQVYALRKLRAGQTVTLKFKHSDRMESLESATFQPENTKEITIARQEDGSFAASLKDIPLVRERVAAQGEIHSSIYEAGEKAGVPHAVMAAFIKIYAHDVDFQRDIQPGDRFEVLYDQPKTTQGKPVGEGSIIYAALRIDGEIKPIYRVIFGDKSADYFDATGHSIRRAILRTPVAAAHITSGFGMRMHPLLGYSKMHKGVDFGAPIGTPIFAAGSGTVEELGFKSGFGRYIRLRHSGQMETIYGHMSRFNARLYRGAHVDQGQVIAYVGMSGRATGPHLHFEIHMNGEAVNPMSVKMPTGRVLEGAQLAQFKSGQSHIHEEFSGLISHKKEPSTADQPFKAAKL